jgi:hypothetical protein
MDAVDFSKKLSIYQTTRFHMPEGYNLNITAVRSSRRLLADKPKVGNELGSPERIYLPRSCLTLFDQNLRLLKKYR